MNVCEIVKKFLLDNGFDGLANEDCGCGIDDLMPCGSTDATCSPAKKCFCEKCDIIECDNRSETGHCWRKVEK